MSTSADPTFSGDRGPSRPLDLEPAARDDRRLAEHDGDLLHWFYDRGSSGHLGRAARGEPAAGQFRVAVDGGEKDRRERPPPGCRQAR